MADPIDGVGHLLYGSGMNTTNLTVRKDSIGTTQIQVEPTAALPPGQVRVRIDKFAFTSNNVTYAALGDAMKYWQFFPTADPAWGRVPVWGFGTVQESHHALLPVGERLWGYFPMANSVDLTPGTIAPAYFFDTAAHRAELHPVYNQYMRCNADPFYTPETEDLQALLRPLFITSWLIDDFLADNAFFGATGIPGKKGVMLLSSASSKTAYGTAFQLAQHEGIEVVGLTSPGNVAFCESLGCYTRVLTYAQLDQIAADTPCVYVDFAGSVGLRKELHTRFTELKYSCSIGATHVTDLGGTKDLPGPKPMMFFAPAQVKKRSAEWGSQGLTQRMVQSWQRFVARVAQPGQPWLTVEHHHGGAAMQAAYLQVLGGKGDARVGHILSL